MPADLPCPTCGTPLGQHAAGECLDAWAATLELGTRVLRIGCRYSANIGAAWRLVEALRQDGWIVRVQEMPAGLPMIGSGDGGSPDLEIHQRACCMLYSNHILEERRQCGLRCGFTELGNTSPLAIVRAFIRARSEELM